jgi:aryl-alcohol dehydrogenase-like predicted oxidoreductase
MKPYAQTYLRKPFADVCEQMQALDDVVKAGYVRYIGMSSCWAWQCQYTTFIMFVLLMFKLP